MNILVKPDGTVQMLYTEEFPMEAIGKPSIRRASHVEPDENGRWWADMSPMNGPKLGPFGKRSDALNAEVEWLEREVL